MVVGATWNESVVKGNKNATLKTSSGTSGRPADLQSKGLTHMHMRKVWKGGGCGAVEEYSCSTGCVIDEELGRCAVRGWNREMSLWIF